MIELCVISFPRSGKQRLLLDVLHFDKSLFIEVIYIYKIRYREKNESILQGAKKDTADFLLAISAATWSSKVAAKPLMCLVYE